MFPVVRGAENRWDSEREKKPVREPTLHKMRCSPCLPIGRYRGAGLMTQHRPLMEAYNCAGLVCRPCEKLT